MRINQTTIALIAVLVAGLFSCSSSAGETENPMVGATSQQPKKATTLPTFNMTDVDGIAVNLSSFKGKKVFVNLWATWCRPCRAEIPSIELLAGKADKNKTVFVMLSLDDDFNVAKNFAKTGGLRLPVYYPAEKLPALFKTEGIPATFIFNENGDLIKQNIGAADYSTAEYIRLLGIR
jgi:thiol-disulfide isomerase/thioredoxin